jgi:hypothetical protein
VCVCVCVRRKKLDEDMTATSISLENCRDKTVVRSYIFLRLLTDGHLQALVRALLTWISKHVGPVSILRRFSEQVTHWTKTSGDTIIRFSC